MSEQSSSLPPSGTAAAPADSTIDQQQDPLLRGLGVPAPNAEKFAQQAAAPPPPRHVQQSDSLFPLLLIGVAIFLLTRRKVLMWGFALAGVISILFAIASLLQLQLLSALGLLFLGYLLFIIAAAIEKP